MDDGVVVMGSIVCGSIWCMIGNDDQVVETKVNVFFSYAAESIAGNEGFDMFKVGKFTFLRSFS